MGNLQNILSTQSLMIAAAIIYMLYVQIAERTFKPKKYIIWPIVLLWITFNTIEKMNGEIVKAGLGIIALSIIGIICGIIAGLITRIYKKEDGITYICGGWRMLLFLLISLPIRFALSYYIRSFPQNAVLDLGTAYLIRLTFQFIARGIIVYLRVPEFWQIFTKQRAARVEKRAARKSRRYEN